MNQNSYFPNQGTAPPYQNFLPPTNGGNQTNNNQDVSYAENILEMNIGKFANFYMSYSDSLEWRDKIFSGIIEAAGRDYALVKEQNSERRFLLWTVYLNYVEFLEPITFKEGIR